MKKTDFLRLIKMTCLAVVAVATVCTTATLLSACGGGGGSGTGSITVREFLSGQKQIILNNTVCMICTERYKRYDYVTGKLVLRSSGKEYGDIQYSAESADGNEDNVPISVTIVLPGNCDDLSKDEDWLNAWFGTAHYENMRFTNIVSGEDEDSEGISGTRITFDLQLNGPNGTYTIAYPDAVSAYDSDLATWTDPIKTSTLTGYAQVLPVD